LVKNTYYIRPKQEDGYSEINFFTFINDFLWFAK